MLSALGYSPNFKAIGAWDYVALESEIFKILTELRYPSLVSDTVIEDALTSRDIPAVIGNTRLRHCISRSLRVAGYVKRSERGHAWDWSGSICAKDVHEKKRGIVSRVRKAISDMIPGMNLMTKQTTIDFWIQ